MRLECLCDSFLQSTSTSQHKFAALPSISDCADAKFHSMAFTTASHEKYMYPLASPFIPLHIGHSSIASKHFLQQHAWRHGKNISVTALSLQMQQHGMCAKDWLRLLVQPMNTASKTCSMWCFLARELAERKFKLASGTNST
jgi:hypothetical protein